MSNIQGVLDVWNEKLVSVGAEILRYREEYIQRLEVIGSEVLSEISGGSEVFSMKYISCVGDISGKSIEEIREALEAKLQKLAQKEILMQE